MIHNLLGDVNIRLYTMDDFFEDKALPLLVPWDPDIDIDDINDDRAARVLDAMWDADPQKVFSAVANESIHIHELDTSIIHGDTTSKSFQGVFDNTDGDELAPIVTFGHNKDHRPDLKQLIFGVGTTADGIPIMAEVTDGNESDKTLNGRWIKNLRSVLGKDIQDFLLYVADSALVTTPNLHLMDKYHIDFISRLPGTFSIEEELKRNCMLQTAHL
jgi:transposase